MTPDEWKRIKQVAGDAWARPLPERERYVCEVCGADENLRREVLNLLQHMLRADIPSRASLKGPIRPV